MTDRPAATVAARRAKSIPFVIGGRRVTPDPDDSVHLRAPSGAEIAFPSFGERAASELLGQDRETLLEVPLQEILAFLNRAGKNWKSDEYARRHLYVRQLQDLLGYSPEAAEAEADRIGILLTAHARIYDVISAELGSRYVMDDWVPREEAWVRAFPRGLSVHIMPGNVPLSNVISMVRALATKNLCVAKAASSDPITPSALALSFLDLDPDHPVTRATSAVYWRHSDAAAADLVRNADVVCAWGGSDAIAWARRHVGDEVPLIPFGPKRSLALVAADADVRTAARGIAHDVVLYDQHACFSTQRVFVEGDPAQLAEALHEQLDEHMRLLPPARQGDDEIARVALARLEEQFLGGDVITGDGWTIAIEPPTAAPSEHPLGRTVYLHPVDALADAYPFVGPDVQTVAIAPWSAVHRHRDALARRGVSRLVEPGLSNLFRIGGTHDSMNPLQQLVRMVAVEAPSSVHGKGMVVPINQTELLKAGKLKDLVL